MKLYLYKITPPKKALLLFMIALLEFSCDTIWESRSGCPCYLSLDISDCRGKSDTVQIWYYNSGDSLVLNDTADLSNSLLYEAPLPRGGIRYHVWRGIQKTEVTEERLEKPMIMQIAGKEFGQIYRFDGRVNTNCEETNDAVKMKKEYARLKILFKNLPDKFENAVKTRVLCETSGYYIDGKFAESSTYMAREMSNNMPLVFIIGRQLHAEAIKLLLFVHREQGEELQIGEIEIGKMLLNGGCDMKEEEISDVELIVDFSASSVTRKVEDWSVTEEVDIEL